MIRTPNPDDEQTIYEDGDIKITGIFTYDGLWLFNHGVRSWSVSAAKRWMTAIAEIVEACRENSVPRLLVYTDSQKAEKFCTLLGFAPYGVIGHTKLMSWEI